MNQQIEVYILLLSVFDGFSPVFNGVSRVFNVMRVHCQPWIIERFMNSTISSQNLLIDSTETFDPLSIDLNRWKDSTSFKFFSLGYTIFSVIQSNCIYIWSNSQMLLLDYYRLFTSRNVEILWLAQLLFKNFNNIWK